MLQPALLISALFGIAQVAFGVVLVRRLTQGWRWAHRSSVIGALAGLWLITSGAGECVVATVSQTQVGHATTIAQVRGVVDMTLLVATIILLVAALIYPLILTAYTRRQAESSSDR